MPGYLYIHIPFCVRKCLYCDFLSIPFDEALAERYLSALCRELAMRKDSAATLRTIYIGGGTPSILAEDAFTRLFSCLRDAFAVSSTAEITVEANPGMISGSAVRHMASLGVNRISMGVQSLNDDELRTLGRIHSAQEAVVSAGLIRESGIENVSLDLMYGIPGQTMATWTTTLLQAVSLGPKHISAYELTPEPGTRLSELIGSGRLVMPDEESLVGMFDAGRERLSSCGYEHYEISNHALPGYRCKHNLNYWERGEYLGLGAGAHSFMNETRSQNVGDVVGYVECLERSELPLEKATPLTAEEAMRETIFLGLRKTEGVALRRLAAFGLDIPGRCANLLDEGYLMIEGDSLRFTKRGMIISNELLVRIFSRLGL